MNNSLSAEMKGKIIKDYTLGNTLALYDHMKVVEGKKEKGLEVCVLAVEKSYIEQKTFVDYHNYLEENKMGIFPKYIEVVQSSNFIYIVFQQFKAISPGCANLFAEKILASIVSLYKQVQNKIELNELFITSEGFLVYLPFYQKNQSSSKFYAQFHNKSILADFYCQAVDLKDKNKGLDILIKNLDNPSLPSLIKAQLNPLSYPNLTEEEIEDQEIMHLMSGVKVNSNMKKEAGEEFIRQSARSKNQNQVEVKEIRNLIDNVNTSMFQFKVIPSKIHKNKIQIKISQSGLQKSEFQTYFEAYLDQFRFLKRSIKSFLQFYRNGFSGIIASYFLTLISSLRRIELINSLENKENMFDLEVDMKKLKVESYVQKIKKELKGEIKMIAGLKNLIEYSSMPVKTFQIIAPYLEEDVALIDKIQLESFTFFFLSALIKGKQRKHLHYLYVIQTMYILLHKNFEVVHFEDEFPKEYDNNFFELKEVMISALLPSWTL